MPNLNLKNIPDALYERLKLAARANHRSLNSELIACLEKNLGAVPVDIDAQLASARALRARVRGGTMPEKEFEELKRLGRE